MVGRRRMLGLSASVATIATLAACAPTQTAAPTTTAKPGAAPTAGSAAAPAKPAGAPTSGTGAGAATPKQPLEQVQLAFCSQVLCVLPFEVARQRGFFEAEGLDVELVYMRGGTQAINALLSESVDFVGTPIDLVVQTVAKGQEAVMLASTSQLPFFALVVGPQQASAITGVQGLAGKRIGVGNLGTTDHLMAQYLLVQNGVDPESVEFVALGPNLYEQLSRGQVEAGMVQEPSLTLLERDGGRVLVNFMKLEDAQRELGGPYQFMGLNTRPEVLETRAETAQKLIRGLGRANRWIRENPGENIVKAIPTELVAGGDVDVFAAALDRYKNDLYPASGQLQVESVQRVIDVQQQSGALEGATVQPDQVFTNRFVEGG